MFQTLREHGEVIPQCCEQDMRQVILTAPHGHVQMDVHYVCPVEGRPVTSWKDRAEIMARHDLVDANDHNKAAKRREKERKAKALEAEKALYRDFEKTVPKELRKSMIQDAAAKART